MIACTNIQNFVEKGEYYASTISVEHLEPFFHTLVCDMNLFRSDMMLFGSLFNFKEPPIMLVVVLINFGVKNKVPQVSFKIVVGDSMLVFSREFDDIKFCEPLDILDVISYYGAQTFALHGSRTSIPFYLITCSSPHNTRKDGDIQHSLGHLLLTPRAYSTSHGWNSQALSFCVIS